LKETDASATALVVALIRATHTRTAPRPLIDDAWADQLVPGSAISAIRQSLLPGGKGDSETAQAEIDAFLRASPAYANVVIRTRYTEDALAAAIARGITQYVLVGAGFDSYALRAPVGAEHVRIFEIDHPATQTLKTRRLSDCGVAVRDTVQFIPADLSKERLGAALARSAFNPDELTFFSLLGVTMYLSAADNRATMREIAKYGAAGSELVFTYIDEAVFSTEAGSPPEAFTDIQKSVASVGEPFISGFDPAALRGNLQKVGLQLEEDLTDPELIARYDPTGENSLISAPQSRIARARTTALNP
jgi:methyltransferase (TIGR00027 family)